MASKKIGIKCLAVTYGFNTTKRLTKNNPDFIIHAPMELITEVLGG